MGNLMKMELRRLFMSKLFYGLMATVALLNIIFQVLPAIFMHFFVPNEPPHVVHYSDFFAHPFTLTFLIVMMIISVVSFTYADIAHGYIKNIAGQVPNKSIIVYAKFIVTGVHNCIFMLVSALSGLLGAVIISAIGFSRLEMDGLMGQAILTFLIKWMLSMAICSILLFFTMAVKNKTLATVIGVLLGTGALGMVYFGLNTAVNNIFHIDDFSVDSYVPDQLINSVNVGTNVAVINAIITAVVCTALFLALTVKVFNSRDVK